MQMCTFQSDVKDNCLDCSANRGKTAFETVLYRLRCPKIQPSRTLPRIEHLTSGTFIHCDGRQRLRSLQNSHAEVLMQEPSSSLGTRTCAHNPIPPRMDGLCRQRRRHTGTPIIPDPNFHPRKKAANITFEVGCFSFSHSSHGGPYFWLSWSR